MKFAIVLAALASVTQSVYGLTVNTPSSVVECEPTMFTWTGGQAPYYLTLVPGGQSMAAPIKSFATQTGESYTWLVDLQANTLFNIALKDSTGTTAYSSVITIQPGSSVSCVNTSVDESSATSGSAGSATSGTTSATSITGTTGTTGTSSAAASASATSGKASGTSSATSSSSTAKSSGAASSLSVSSGMGIAGVMGLLGAALF